MNHYVVLDTHFHAATDPRGILGVVPAADAEAAIHKLAKWPDDAGRYVAVQVMIFDRA